MTGPQPQPDPKPKPVACVFCHSTDTEEFSLYGQTLMGSQYYCNQCRTIFEVIRYDDADLDDDLADDLADELDVDADRARPAIQE